jgi:hypothetical protein
MSVRAAGEVDVDVDVEEVDAGELLWARAIEVRTEVAARTVRAIFIDRCLWLSESSSGVPHPPCPSELQRVLLCLCCQRESGIFRRSRKFGVQVPMIHFLIRQDDMEGIAVVPTLRPISVRRIAFWSYALYLVTSRLQTRRCIDGLLVVGAEYSLETGIVTFFDGVSDAG